MNRIPVAAATPAIGRPVVVTRRYPVHGVIELFATVVFQDGPASAAVVRVTQPAGLYQRGDCFVARVTELEPAAFPSAAAMNWSMP
jgi:hypothetical protein